MTQLTADQAHATNPTAAGGRGRRSSRLARRWPSLAIVLVLAILVVVVTAQGKAPSYVLGSARNGTVSETVAVSGTLAPTRSWNLYFRSSGSVTSVLVRPGEHVHPGQALATVNPGPLQAQVSSLQAAVAAAEAKLSADQVKLDGEQAKQAAHPATTSAQATIDAAVIAADQSAITADQDASTAAEQQLATAQANLAAATLRSPAAAIVAQVNVNAGQNIGGGGGAPSGSGGGSNPAGASGSAGATTGSSNAAVSLMNGSLQALGQVPDSQIAQVHVGQRALVIPTGQTTAIHGRVEAIIPTPSAIGGVITYPVEIAWSGHPAGVFNGMSAEISVVVATASGVTVPSSAVQTSGTQSWVLVLHGAHVHKGHRGRGGRAVRQSVVVGPSGGGLTIVRSGLAAGAQVVLANNNTPLPSSTSVSQRGSGKAPQIRKLLG